MPVLMVTMNGELQITCLSILWPHVKTLFSEGKCERSFKSTVLQTINRAPLADYE